MNNSGNKNIDLHIFYCVTGSDSTSPCCFGKLSLCVIDFIIVQGDWLIGKVDGQQRKTNYGTFLGVLQNTLFPYIHGPFRI